MESCYERQIQFFGIAGQERLKAQRVAVIGVGGLGSHIVQQLAFLGVGKITVIDDDDLDRSNLNRLIGARYTDPIPGTSKVSISKRLIKDTNPFTIAEAIHKNLRSKESFEAIKNSTCVFGCFDNDGGRLILNELCIAYEIPYFDLATEIPNEDVLNFGGRVFLTHDSSACLYCIDEVDKIEAMQYLSNDCTAKDHKDVYGVPSKFLGNSGPAVVFLNGVIASLAITEFIALVTEIRKPFRFLKYGGREGIVRKSLDEPTNKNCYYCHSIRGIRSRANVERYCI